jgi:hypothetical protein
MGRCDASHGVGDGVPTGRTALLAPGHYVRGHRGFAFPWNLSIVPLWFCRGGLRGFAWNQSDDNVGV